MILTQNMLSSVAGKLLHSVKLQPTYISSFEFNPTEFMLAAVTSARTVRVWDLEVMKQIGCTYPDSSPVKALAFSGQDSSLCTATNDSAKLWHWEPVKLSASVSIPWEGIADMIVAPSTNILCGVSSIANVVSLWNLNPDSMVSEGAARPSKYHQPQSYSTTGPPRADILAAKGSRSHLQREQQLQQHQPRDRERNNGDMLLPAHCADPDLAVNTFGISSKHKLTVEIIKCNLLN